MSTTRTPLKIERDIPYPGKSKTGVGRPRLYPFADMEIGDSVFVESAGPYFSRMSSLSASLARAKKKTGFNLKWEPVPGGFRIWRLEGKCELKRAKPAQRRQVLKKTTRRAK
ncbi:hypothetical protein [Bradyrhizobium sp. USDA 10063]